VLEYHLIVPQETNEFTRTPERLRQDLEELRRRGYVPVNMTDVLDKKIQTCRAAPRRWCSCSTTRRPRSSATSSAAASS
jgi:hypothetical protein